MECPICCEALQCKSSYCNDPTTLLHSGPCKSAIVHTTPCGHSFHTCCLVHLLWIHTGCDTVGEQGELSCPLCRALFTLTV
jgi:hypothetical protein